MPRTMPPLRTLVGALSARLLGAVLLVAAYAKAIDPALFALDLRDLVPLPPGVAYVAAVAVVAFEAGLGAALLVGWRHPRVLLLANATFVAFAAVVVWQMMRPGGAPTSCGCFGQLLERTPAQALYEDLGFVVLSGLAWLGRTVRSARSHWRTAVIAAVVGGTLAAAAPRLPLDDRATNLAPGMTVEATHLDQIIPELRNGRHLVLLLDRADPPTRERIPALNAGLQLPEGKTRVWGLADDNSELAAAFLWTAGPAFEVRSAPPRMLRTLYRTLPRSALIDGDHVIATWTGFPPDSALDALARGELP